MAAPPFLAVRNKNGAAAQVGRLVGGTTFGQVGNNLTTSMETPTVYHARAHNNAVQFGDSLYAAHRGTIYKLSSPWTTWSVAGTFAVKSGGGYAFHTGISIVDNAGTPTMVILYVTAAANYVQASYSTNGTTWTTGTVGTLAVADTWYIGRSFVFRNSVFWSMHTGTGSSVSSYVYQYDVASNALTLYGNLGSVHLVSACMCAFDNELYMVAPYNGVSSDSLLLYRFSGGTFTGLVSLTLSYAVALITAERGGCAVFADGGKLYCLMVGGTGYYGDAGNYVIELTPSGATFTQSDITSTVLPAALRGDRLYGGSGGSAVASVHWYVGVDNDTDPTSPKIYLWRLSTDSAGSWSYYEWNGSSTFITGGSAAGSVGLAMPVLPEGGGERWWSSGEMHIEIVGTAAVLGGEQISFKAYGASGSSDKTVKFYFNADEEAPTTQASLTGAVSGGSMTRNGNQLENVNADGATIYTCVRDVSVDGLALGDKESLMPRIEV